MHDGQASHGATRHVWSCASPKEAVATLLLATRSREHPATRRLVLSCPRRSADAALTRVTCDLNDLLRYTSGTQENQKRPASANRAHRKNPLKTWAPALFNVCQKTWACSDRTARCGSSAPYLLGLRSLDTLLHT